jgi:hypothetical protein
MAGWLCVGRAARTPCLVVVTSDEALAPSSPSSFFQEFNCFRIWRGLGEEDVALAWTSSGGAMEKEGKPDIQH